MEKIYLELPIVKVDLSSGWQSKEYAHKPYSDKVVTVTKYYLKYSCKSDGYMEDALFASKEELLKSL